MLSSKFLAIALAITTVTASLLLVTAAPSDAQIVRDHRTPPGAGPEEKRAIALRKCSEALIYCNKMCSSSRSAVKRQDAHQQVACRTDCGNEGALCRKRAG